MTTVVFSNEVCSTFTRDEFASFIIRPRTRTISRIVYATGQLNRFEDLFGQLCVLLVDFIGFALSHQVSNLLTYLLTYLPTYVLTPWNIVLLQKLTGTQLVKKSSPFFGT